MIDKFLKKISIDKKVDPGVGSVPKATIAKPVIGNQQATIKETTISTLVDDTLEVALSVQNSARELLQELDNTHNDNPIFTAYAEKVRGNFFNPALWLSDPSAKLVKKYEPIEITVLERQVYRQITDPRAAFYQDIYTHLADAGLSQYVLNKYWMQLTNANNWYGSFDNENELVRNALYREKQYLDTLNQSLYRIRNNKLESISHQFLEVLSYKIVNRIAAIEPSSQIGTVNKLIRTLTHIKSMLFVSMVINTSNWERFSSNLGEIFSDFAQVTAAKVTRITSYSFIGGLHGDVSTLLTELGQFLPLGLDLEDIPEFAELISQVDSSFNYCLANIEEDLVYREGIQIKLEENRQILLRNSRKNTKTKQYILLLDEVIEFLKELKSTLTHTPDYLESSTAILTAKLISKSDAYIRNVSHVIKPS